MREFVPEYRRRNNTQHFRYTKVMKTNSNCIYCGAISDAWDHVPPITVAYRYKSSVLKLYRTCAECNSTLSNRDLLYIADRKAYLYKKYCKKYKDILKMPRWSAKEIQELEGSLQDYIKASVKQKQFLVRRLNKLQRSTHHIAFDKSKRRYSKQFKTYREYLQNGLT